MLRNHAVPVRLQKCRLARRYLSIAHPQANLLASLPAEVLLPQIRRDFDSYDSKFRLAVLYRVYREVFVGSKYIDRQGLMEQFDAVTDYRQAPRLLDGLESFSPDEFAAFVEMVGPERLELRTFRQCVEQFAGFIDHELVLGDPGFRREGARVEVSRRRMEPHTFARIAVYLLGGSVNYPAIMEPLEPMMQAYLAKEWKNLSLEDHAAVLGAMLSHFEPSEVHADFAKKRLPASRISNYMTAVILVDLVATMSLVEGSHHLQDPHRLFLRTLDQVRASLPYMSDWRLSDKLAFIPLAAMAVMRADSKRKAGPEVWDLLFAGFQENIEFLSHYQISVFLETAHRAGAAPKSSALLPNICTYFTDHRDRFGLEDNIHAAFVVDSFAGQTAAPARNALRDKLRDTLSEASFRKIRLQKSVERLDHVFRQEPDMLHRLKTYRAQSLDLARHGPAPLGS